MSANPITKRLHADFDRVMQDEADEAVNGLFAEEPGDCFVCADDRPPSPRVSLYDDIPMPRDPYGCANPVSQTEEE